MKVSLTCNRAVEYISVEDETKAFGGRSIHGLGLILCIVFGLAAVVVSFFLMQMHATHYSRPWEQKHIIRILFMVPIYAVVSFLSFYFYHSFVYFQVARDCYDAIAIISFFQLLCNYIAPDLKGQKEYFQSVKVKKWVFPLSCVHKTPTSGLTWFNLIWTLVFQYCFVRVFFTIVSIATQATGHYCAEGLSPKYAHVWIAVLSAVSVVVAMYCIVQFNYQIKDDIAGHRPWSKLLSIKLVVFFVFWQALILSFLVSGGAIKPGPRTAEPDIVIGIPAFLICIEMFLFSLMHLWCYNWKEYDLRNQSAEKMIPGQQPAVYCGGRFGWKAWLEAFNLFDIAKAIGRGFKFSFVGYRQRHEYHHAGVEDGSVSIHKVAVK